MAYYDQALLSRDGHFRDRISACAATEEQQSGRNLQGLHPTTWADKHQWAIAASPGFADSYAYAINTEVPDPGKDPAVITDGMILAQVQPMLNPPEEPPV